MMQPNLFCFSCQLFNSCGGTKTSPCGCMYAGTPQAYKCDNCAIGCRQRDISTGGFVAHVNQTKSLAQVEVHHDTAFPVLPILLPIRGGKTNVHLPVKFATVDLAQMLRYHNTRSKKTLRETIGVPDNAPLVGIINSNDELLERFWEMPDRKGLFKHLVEAGTISVTGPTFSITETYDKRIVPDSHNVMMMNRHHQILYEIGEAGLMPIPNIYFRNRYDINAWANWLSINDIIFIKRDFSMTKGVCAFVREEVALMKEIIIQSGKTFHIILTGISSGADEILRLFAEIGCRCSFVTSGPMYKAILGGERLYVESNKIKSISDRSVVNKQLVQPNYVTLEEHLSWIALQEYPQVYGASVSSNFDGYPDYELAA